MASQNLVNIGSGNGLLPDGTKPLPEPMLIYHYIGADLRAITQVLMKLIHIMCLDIIL